MEAIIRKYLTAKKQKAELFLVEEKKDNEPDPYFLFDLEQEVKVIDRLLTEINELGIEYDQEDLQNGVFLSGREKMAEDIMRLIPVTCNCITCIAQKDCNTSEKSCPANFVEAIDRLWPTKKEGTI